MCFLIDRIMTKDYLNRTLDDYKQGLKWAYEYKPARTGKAIVCIVSTESKHPAIELGFKYAFMGLNEHTNIKGELIFTWNGIDVYFKDGTTQKVYIDVTKVP